MIAASEVGQHLGGVHILHRDCCICNVGVHTPQRHVFHFGKSNKSMRIERREMYQTHLKNLAEEGESEYIRSAPLFILKHNILHV